MRCIPIRIEPIGLVAKVGLRFPRSERNETETRWIEALVDTGATDSAISVEIAKQLDLPKVGEREITTLGGRLSTRLFHGDLALGQLDAAGPQIFHDRWLTGLIHSQPQFDALLGMDILRKGRLMFDGPANTATFCW